MENNNNFKVESARMRSLMERMDTPHTHTQALLSEERMIEEATAPTRKLKSAEEAFDILDKIGNNLYVALGYVSGADMQTSIKRKNPATNKMKSYPDWEKVSKHVGIKGVSGIIKVTVYNFRYNNTKSMDALYKKFNKDQNDIRAKYGLPPTGHKGYTDTMNYGNGIKSYAGSKEKLAGHTYSDQNTYNCRKDPYYYPIDGNGNAYKGADGKPIALDKKQIVDFLKNTERSDSGVNALKKMNAEQSTIDAYLSEINSLKMFYQRFEYSSILFVTATVDGQRIVYINDKLMRNVEGIDINPQDFIAIAKERYAESLEDIEQAQQQQEEN